MAAVGDGGGAGDVGGVSTGSIVGALPLIGVGDCAWIAVFVVVPGTGVGGEFLTNGMGAGDGGCDCVDWLVVDGSDGDRNGNGVRAAETIGELDLEGIRSR